MPPSSNGWRDAFAAQEIPWQESRFARAYGNPSLTSPPALRCVKSMVTDLAWLVIDANGFLLRELVQGPSIDDVKAATGAPLRVANDVCEMQFE